jgi:phosphoribosylpyrophosphate synthetase
MPHIQILHLKNLPSRLAGSTIIKAAEILKSDGCQSITVMCSHALMTEESTKKIKAAGVDRIATTTNSVPKMEALGEFVETLDLSPVISLMKISA